MSVSNYHDEFSEGGYSDDDYESFRAAASAYKTSAKRNAENKPPAYDVTLQDSSEFLNPEALRTSPQPFKPKGPDEPPPPEQPPAPETPPTHGKEIPSDDWKPSLFVNKEGRLYEKRVRETLLEVEQAQTRP